MCLECLTTSDLLIAVGALATFLSVLVALYLGVGGWRRDSRIREAEKSENQRTYSILLAQDIRLARQQGREIRGFLEEARLGPSEADDGSPINVFENHFAAEHGALLIFSPISLLQQSSEWAKHLPHSAVKSACAISTYVNGWNEKAELLRKRPSDMTLPEELSDDLVFTLDCLEGKSKDLLERLNELAA